MHSAVLICNKICGLNAKLSFYQIKLSGLSTCKCFARLKVLGHVNNDQLVKKFSHFPTSGSEPLHGMTGTYRTLYVVFMF